MRSTDLLQTSTATKRGFEQVIQDRYVTLPNGLKIHYVEAGPQDAPVLIMTHGFLGSWKDWRHNILPLVAFSPTPRRVIALDWPGFGLSDKPETGYSIFYYAGILKSFVRAMNIEKFDLMGHSMGGKYNLAFTIVNPGYVRSLILVANDGFGKDPWWASFSQADLFQKVTDSSVKMFGNPNFVRANLYRVFFDRKFYPNEAEVQEIVASMREPKQAAALKAMTLAYPSLSLQRTKLANRLSEISCPTVLIWGKQDRVIPIEVAYKIRQQLAKARLHTFENCGHMPQIEKAAEFNQLVLNFLAENARNKAYQREGSRVA